MPPKSKNCYYNVGLFENNGEIFHFIKNVYEEIPKSSLMFIKVYSNVYDVEKYIPIVFEKYKNSSEEDKVIYNKECNDNISNYNKKNYIYYGLIHNGKDIGIFKTSNTSSVKEKILFINRIIKTKSVKKIDKEIIKQFVDYKNNYNQKINKSDYYINKNNIFKKNENPYKNGMICVHRSNVNNKTHIVIILKCKSQKLFVLMVTSNTLWAEYYREIKKEEIETFNVGLYKKSFFTPVIVFSKNIKAIKTIPKTNLINLKKEFKDKFFLEFKNYLKLNIFSKC